MIGGKKVVAIIPARGESKRLPGKNIRLLKDKPLIVYSIQAAQKCPEIDKIVVSTDSKEIANVASSANAEVHIRNKDLSSDTATTIDVLKDLLKRLCKYDICITLQPTSPLRTTYDIKSSLDLFDKKMADAVISVCRAEHPPQWTNKIGRDGEMDGFISELIVNQRSQDLGDYYRLNGAIYCNLVKKILTANSLIFDRNSYAYVMPLKRSVDIDTIDDLELAEYYLSKT